MKLYTKAIFLMLLGLNLACSTTKVVTKPISTEAKYLFQKQPNKIYFTILQLNDVYEIAPIQGGKFGGMARVETLRQYLLKENPNTFTMLAGDFLNPSLLGTLKLDGERIKGKQMVDVMNAMNFELVAFGNHEFDVSYEQLQNRLDESNFEWVSANVLHNQNGKAHYFHKVKYGKKEAVNDSYILDVNQGNQSVKVGFISVCLPSNPRDYVVYGDIYAEAIRSYNEVKNNTDVVLGLTHLEIDQDKKLAKLLPNIPLIMGGHEHTNSYDTVGNVTITKADANAKSVYIHRFEFDPVTKAINVKSELKVIDETIKADDKVGAVVQKWQNILETKIKEVIDNPNEIIYETEVPLEARDTPIRSVQTNMGKVITEAMSFAYNDEVDCAIVNGGSVRIDDVLLGKINAVDIFRVLPYGGPIFKIKIKGSLLKEVLNYGLESKGSGAYLQRFKAKNNNGYWEINNQKLNFDKVYTVAISDYLMKGFDIPFLKESNEGVVNVYKPNTTELGYDIRKAVIEYLKSK